MVSKLKCPFCGEELYDNRAVSAVASRIDIYLCVNSKCGESDKLIGTKELWQALIQSQKDLEESQQATLENAQTVLEIHKDLEIARKALTFHYQDELDKPTAPAKWFAVATEMCDYADEALEQIEHKE
jgi:hypothetical protein